MSKDIYNSDEDIRLSESADVYMPHTYKVKGEIDGEAYDVLINERALPEGIPPDPAVITKVIPWNQKFYMEWEIQGNPETDVVVSDAGSEVVRLAGYTDKSVIFDQSSLVNGVQYSLQVIATIIDVETLSVIENVTLENKTPQNVSINSTSGDSASVSWDSVSDTSGYIVIVTDEDLSTIIQTIRGVGTNSVNISGLYEGNFGVQVRAVSEGGIFESGLSTKVTFKLDVTAPATPTGLQEDLVTTSTINISWTANTESDIALYRVYVDGVEHSNSPVSHPTTSFAIDGLNTDTSYTIKLSAEDSSGNESAKTAPLTSKTAAGITTGDYYFAYTQANNLYSIEIATGNVVDTVSSAIIGLSPRILIVDGERNYVYVSNSGERIQQYSYNPSTGAFTTPANWDQNYANPIQDLRIGPNGDVYYLGSDVIKRLNVNDGTTQWTSSSYWGAQGMVLHSNGIMIPSAWRSKTMIVLDYATGNQIDSWTVKDTGGSTVSSNQVGRGAVDIDGYIYIAGLNTGLYKVDPSTYNTVAQRAISPGAGQSFLNKTHLFLGRADGVNDIDGGGQILLPSDLSQVLTGINCKGGDNYSTDIAVMPFGIDTDGNIYYTDASNNLNAIVKDSSGNIVSTFTSPDGQAVNMIAVPPGRAYPFLIS